MVDEQPNPFQKSRRLGWSKPGNQETYTTDYTKLNTGKENKATYDREEEHCAAKNSRTVEQ